MARLEQADLLTNVLLIGNRQAAGMDKLSIPPGQMAVVYMWVTLDSAARLPAGIAHKISVKAGKGQDEIAAECSRIAVGREIATIAAPLRGDNWVAANGPSNSSGHRRTLIPIDGRARVAQRFAIDWVRMNTEARRSPVIRWITRTTALTAVKRWPWPTEQ